MNIKTLKETVHTYQTWELEEMQKIIGDDELTKQHIIRVELARRKRKNYKDKSIDPKIPIRVRLIEY